MVKNKFTPRGNLVIRRALKGGGVIIAVAVAVILIKLSTSTSNAQSEPVQGSNSSSTFAGIQSVQADQSADSSDLSDDSSTDEPTDASAATIQTYTVQSGDTLSGIAAKFSISVNTIRWANDLGSKGVIKPGEELVILPVSGVQYTVKKGDTLSGIASHFKISVDDIMAHNSLDSESAIKPGMTLIIPSVQAVAQSPVISKQQPSKDDSATVSLPSVQPQQQSVSQVATPPSPVPSSDTSPQASGSTGIQSGSLSESTPPLSGEIRGYYMQPIPGSQLTQGLHGSNAVDFGAPVGTSVRAAAAGIVIIAKTGYNGGYGNYIVINHDNGTQTLYAHLSEIDVTEGTTVTQGEHIALSGRTGRVTGPHLHFEVRGAVNPWAHDALGTKY